MKESNNFAKVAIMGKVSEEEPKVIVEYGVEKIYECRIFYKRTSGTEDEFIINYSNAIDMELKPGDVILVTGSLRTTKYEDVIKIYIKADKIEQVESEPDIYTNEIEVQGVLTKTPRIRKSYSDEKTDIADFTLEVKRNQGKTSYIPVVAWNNNARLSKTLKADTLVNVLGRVQSHRTSKGYLMTEVTTTSFQETK